MRLVKRILKILVIILLVVLTGFLIAAHQFLRPATDVAILEDLTTNFTEPIITYNTYKEQQYRVIYLQKSIDTTLPILLFVHGSPGGAMDFKRYLKDSLLNSKATMIAYDRIGYGPKNHGDTPANMEDELGVLHDLLKELPTEKVVLAGYSYGGPVVLASDKVYKAKVTMAPAVVGEYEPMFKALAFYKFAPTRWLMPPKARAAAKEKYAHVYEFPKYRNKWNSSPSKILNIHGDKDWIVPYKNSEFLQDIFDEDQFEMVTIPDGGHDLIWSDFELIKKQLLKTLN